MSSIIKTNEYFDKEILIKANNRFYTPDEFNPTLTEKLQSGIATVLYAPQHLLSILSSPWAI